MGEGDPVCLKETQASGYMFNAWKWWRPLCLSVLSLEDAEDIWIFGFIVIGFLLIGIGGYLFYQKNGGGSGSNLEAEGAVLGLRWAAGTQTYSLGEQGRRLEATNGDLDRVSGLIRRVSSNMETFSARLGGN